MSAASAACIARQTAGWTAAALSEVNCMMVAALLTP
jgi:hypothetical protein